jgi:galactokinase
VKNLITRSTSVFQENFVHPPQAVGVAPGRLEILGNHTDYNGGYILSVALDRETAVAIRMRDDFRVRIWSESTGETAGFDVRDARKVEEHPWADYVKGVVVELRKAGVKITGFDAAIVSTVPIGAGLSSSAALEVATAMAVRGIFPYNLPPMELAKLCRRAENEFVGMGCGILDQFSAIFGAKDSFLFLDCMTLKPQVVETRASGVNLVVCDSTAQRELVEGDYDTRRRECSSAAKKLGEELGRKIRFLREVSLEEFQTHKNALTAAERKRAHHVLHENARVLAGLEAVRYENLPQLGSLMLESHASSRDYFENSCPELDALIEIARQVPGFLGGKLSGGGFGGATVNLVARDQADEFQIKVKQGFSDRFRAMPETVVCSIGEGARSVRLKG